MARVEIIIMRKKGDFLVFGVPAIEQAEIEVLAVVHPAGHRPLTGAAISLTAGVVEPPRLLAVG